MARMLNASHAGRGLQPCPERYEVTDGFVPCEKNLRIGQVRELFIMLMS